MTAAPVEHRLTLGPGDLCWFEWGEPTDWPSLLLLHATGFHARLWDQTLKALAALGSPLPHIVAPDLRGHGRSYKPASIGDWSATAADLVPLVDAAIPGQVVGVGHSMGGYCAAALAGLLPEKVARLLLVDPVILPPETYDPNATEPDPSTHPVARRRGRWPDAQTMIDAFAGRSPYSAWRPAALADYCRFGLNPAADGDGLVLGCPPEIEASAYLGAARNDAMGMLAKVRCPTTVLRARVAERQGPMDFSISPTWPELAAHLPDALDLCWPDVSHFIPMEQPERLAVLIREIYSKATG